jgi:WD40 repeat protein
MECHKTLIGHEKSVLALCATANANNKNCENNSKESHYLFSGSRDCTIKVWDLETFHCVRTLTGHEHDILALTLDKYRLYSSSADFVLKVIN